jgi:hypothetical protein
MNEGPYLTNAGVRPQLSVNLDNMSIDIVVYFKHNVKCTNESGVGGESSKRLAMSQSGECCKTPNGLQPESSY